MDSFNQKVERINTAKEAIKTSLTNKGLEPSNNIEDYAALIDSIEQGSGSGDVKLFTTIGEMNASTDNKEGDLATICGKNTYPVYESTLFNNIVVKESLTLSRSLGYLLQSAFRSTESSSGYSMSIMASSTSIRISGNVNSNNFTITYTSTDGLNYELTSNTYPGSLEQYFKFYDQYYIWDEIISEILFTEMNEYMGLYEYKDSEGYLPIKSQLSLSSSADIKPGVRAIGTSGEIIGTDDFYKNIELSNMVCKNTNTKKYEKGIFVESTQENLSGIISKEVTDIKDFKNLVVFKKGIPYYYEEFDDTNGTANITFVFSSYHVRICGDVTNLCAYMYIYDLNNKLVYEETVSVPKLDKAINGRLQRFCIGETKSDIIFGLYCQQTKRIWTFDKETQQITLVCTSDSETEINDCSDIACYNDDWFFVSGYYSSIGKGFRIFDKDGVSQYYNTSIEYFGSYFNKAIDDNYYYLSYKYGSSYKDYGINVIRKSDKAYIGKIDTSGSYSSKTSQLVVAKGFDGKVYLLKGTEIGDEKSNYNYSLYLMEGTTLTLIKENVFTATKVPTRNILYCIWDGTNCALLMNNGSIWDGEYTYNIENKADGMFIEYFKGEAPYCLGEIKDGMLIRYTFDLNKVFGDNDKISIIKSGISNEYLVLFNHFNIYAETITPEEYNTAVDTADIILGQEVTE